LTYLERQKCYRPDKKILFKKQWFDLEVKVPWRSLLYATHRLMIMHIQTICQWTVLLDLFELFDLEVKGQGPRGHYGHAPIPIVIDLSRKTKMLWPGQENTI
jgi:hypothetical protein